MWILPEVLSAMEKPEEELIAPDPNISQEITDGLAKGQFRNVVFTLNNYTEEDIKALSVLPYTDDDVQYIIFGKEIAPTTGTPHLQGYMEFSKKKTFVRVKETIGKRAWFGIRKARTAAPAINYCKKDGDFIEVGDPKSNTQGKRTDLKDIRSRVTNGGMAAIMDAHEAPTFIVMRTAEKYLSYTEQRREIKSKVIWVYGPPGYGKTHMCEVMAANLASDGRVFVKDDEEKWFDGYDAHEVVLFNDFDPSWAIAKRTKFNNLCDKYGSRVEFKGGSRQFKPLYIIINTILPPLAFFNKNQDHLGADILTAEILRRLNYVINIEKMPWPRDMQYQPNLEDSNLVYKQTIVTCHDKDAYQKAFYGYLEYIGDFSYIKPTQCKNNCIGSSEHIKGCIVNEKAMKPLFDHTEHSGRSGLATQAEVKEDISLTKEHQTTSYTADKSLLPVETLEIIGATTTPMAVPPISTEGEVLSVTINSQADVCGNIRDIKNVRTDIPIKRGRGRPPKKHGPGRPPKKY